MVRVAVLMMMVVAMLLLLLLLLLRRARMRATAIVRPTIHRGRGRARRQRRALLPLREVSARGRVVRQASIRGHTGRWCTVCLR